MLLSRAIALSASQFVHKKISQQIHTSTHYSAGLELTKLTYTRLKDNLIRHRGDRYHGACRLFAGLSIAPVPVHAISNSSKAVGVTLDRTSVVYFATDIVRLLLLKYHPDSVSGLVVCGTCTITSSDGPAPAPPYLSRRMHFLRGALMLQRIKVAVATQKQEKQPSAISKKT